MPPNKRAPAVARRQLGLRIRKARADADKTQTDIADALEWSVSKVRRIENGQVGTNKPDLMAFMAEIGIESADQDELIDLAREGRESTPASTIRDIVSQAFAEWLDHEAVGTVIRWYETKVLPGPLQIEAYARVIVSTYQTDKTADAIDRIVRARIVDRANSLTGPNGPRMLFIVDEAAFRRVVGNEVNDDNYAIMIAQLNHLKHMNTIGRLAMGETIEEDLNPSIGIQIVPFRIGAYPAMRGPFELLEFNGDTEDMIYFENPDGGVVIKDIDSTAPYLDTFISLERSLPGHAETNGMIDHIIADMKEDRNGLPVSGRIRSVDKPAPA